MVEPTSQHDWVSSSLQTGDTDHARQLPSRRADQKADTTTKQALAAIVPAYNEVPTVAALLEKLCQQPCISQVVIVDDGSTDATWQAICDFAEQFSGDTQVCGGGSHPATGPRKANGLREARPTNRKLTMIPNQCDSAGESWRAPIRCGIELKLVKHRKNQGKGRSIRTGLEYVTASHVIIQDADLEYNPCDINRLWDVMRSGECDVVYGSRYLQDGSYQHGRVILQSGIRLLNLLCRLCHGVQTTDEATCYKMFRLADLQEMDLKCEQFEFCPEVTKHISPMGLRFTEVAVGYLPRTYQAGKKLGVRDGLQAIGMLMFR